MIAHNLLQDTEKKTLSIYSISTDDAKKIVAPKDSETYTNNKLKKTWVCINTTADSKSSTATKAGQIKNHPPKDKIW